MEGMKVSRQRQKGTRFETAVKEVFHETGIFPDCERTGSRAYELGDLVNTGIWTVECKNQKAMKLAEWLSQAEAAAERTGLLPVVIHKRRGKNASQAYVTMDLTTFIEANRRII